LRQGLCCNILAILSQQEVTMKAFSVFDDLPSSCVEMLESQGVEVTLLPHGEERPQGDALQQLFYAYDILFISTAQKMPESMFDGIETRKVIATASSGTDHIHVPEAKKHLVRIANATHANRSTVAEHTFALALLLRKHLLEGRQTAFEGLPKKAMSAKPVDLFGSTLGVVGAGGIATAVLNLGKGFGMRRLCWTFHPDHHGDLVDDGVEMVSLDALLQLADVISVNIPLSEATSELLDARRISLLKDTAVLISTSRPEVIDNAALLRRASLCPSFCVGLDYDAKSVVGQWTTDMLNVIVTPHIAGGTIESRRRLFEECTQNVVEKML